MTLTLGPRAERSRPGQRDLLLHALTSLPDYPAAFRSRLDRFAAEATVEDWQQLLALAGYHGVLGVIADAVSLTHGLPVDIAETARRWHAVEHLWQDHVMTGLASIAALLARQGIEALALKGPALAARLYPAATMRHCMDVDLLVDPRSFDAAAAALTAAGYTSESGVSAAYLRRHAHHLHFTKPGAVAVELHFRTYAGFGVVVPAAALLERAVAYPLPGSVPVNVPAPEDEYLYLAVHAAGHSFVRLVWLYDLKLLRRRTPSLDWQALFSRAAALGVGDAVAYATRLLAEWLGETLPDLAWRQRPLRSRLADRLLPEVSRPQEASARDNLGGLVFTSLLCDRWSSGASLLTHHLGRVVRRRLTRAAPGVFPEDWKA